MGVGLTTVNIKTLTVTQTRSIDNETTMTGGVAAGAAMTLLGQGQPKALWPIGPIVVPQVTDDHKVLEREDHSGDNTGREST